MLTSLDCPPVASKEARDGLSTLLPPRPPPLRDLTATEAAFRDAIIKRVASRDRPWKYERVSR